MDISWKDKTCLKCLFNIGDNCRRFPPANAQFTDGKHAAYPLLETWTRACAEYKEPE